MERITYADLHQRMLEQYAPPSLIIDEEYDIVHLSENAGPYLQFTGGDSSQNVLKAIYKLASQVGADGAIEKPFSVKAIRDMVNRLLGSSDHYIHAGS